MTHNSGRIQQCFAALKQKNQAGFVAFVTAGDPDYTQSLALLKMLSDEGVDVIEVGMPFSDPMADGPAIQRSSLRALENGQTLAKTLDLVAEFRAYDASTPIILMGYFNPIYQMGIAPFLKRCQTVGVDGLIVVDLPPETDDELCLPAREAGLDFIRLVTPTTDKKRLEYTLQQASGFLYYVSITGVTGTAAPTSKAVGHAVNAIKSVTELPVAIGFGIRTPEQAADMAKIGDAVVVGSALVDMIETAIETDEQKPDIMTALQPMVRDLVQATHKAKAGSC